ncbi:MAG: hypothetical protein F6J87_29795 [Spirulina sp. SIO3F2]|nr:hypothetical protein [Spirulina sp. SIO3F2]
MANARDSRFDIIRALVILNAITIHCHIEFILGKIALPFEMLQGGLFSVGGFFFFTGGYMTQRIYLPRFSSQPRRLSRRLVQKGGSILGIYLIFLVVMYGITGLTLPSVWPQVLFQARFYTEVLITFGLLFALIPGILWLRSRLRWAIWLLLAICSALFLLYPTWDSPSLWLDYLCDRTVTVYPLLTALITFCVGFLCAEGDAKYQLAQRPRFQYFALGVLLIHLLILGSSKTYLAFIIQKPFYTFFESLTPYLAIAALTPPLRIPLLKTALTWPPFLALGIESLLTFILANSLIILFPLSAEAGIGMKLLVLMGICIGVAGIGYGKQAIGRF